MQPRQRFLRSEEGLFPSDNTLPAVIESDGERSLNALCEWIVAERGQLDQKLLTHGALLFRGFDVSGASDFERVALAVDPNLRDRLPLDDGLRRFRTRHVYDGADYQQKFSRFEHLPFHYEDNYYPVPPSKIMFHCTKPAPSGGETVIVDGRRVYNSIPLETRQALEGTIRTERRFIERPVLFENARTKDVSDIEEICRQFGVDRFVWHTNPDGSVDLIIATDLPMVNRHPVTNEHVWFNSINTLSSIGRLSDQLLSITRVRNPSLRATRILGLLGELPALRAIAKLNNIDDGEGKPGARPTAQMAIQISRAHWKNAVAFHWRAGDVLVIDNWMVAHGRLPHTGGRELFACTADFPTKPAQRAAS